MFSIDLAGFYIVKGKFWINVPASNNNNKDVQATQACRVRTRSMYKLRNPASEQRLLHAKCAPSF